MKRAGSIFTMVPLLFGMGLGAFASDTTPEALVRDALAAERSEAKIRTERLERAEDEFRALEAKLAAARSEIERARARAATLEARLREGEQTLALDEQRLHHEVGNLRESFAAARRTATELSLELQHSVVSTEHRGRRRWLDELAASERVPTMATLERLWRAIELEITEAGQVRTFRAPVVGPDGGVVEREVVRVGPFSAIAGEDLLILEPGQETLRAFASRALPTLESLLGLTATAPPGLAMLTFDPTGGQLLRVRDLQLSWTDQLRAGGAVGYTIIGLGALGLLIGISRLVYLGWQRARVRRQLRHLTALSRRNPLGRVLAAVSGPADEEELDIVLERAVLAESRRIVRGESLLKLFAALAPLLGLLGTVTGMIITFQTLSTLGTSDPKLMAGGISQALVTTALGLIVAVPLLLLHATVSARSRDLLRVLDDQALGLLAQRNHVD